MASSGFSAIEQQRQVELFIEEGRMGPEVIGALLPGGRPSADETSLWDYKITLPTPDDAKAAGESFQALLHDIVKDVVAFHNSHGGYIVAGVKNGANPEYRGFDKDFDCHELAKSLFATTGEKIDCRFEYETVSCPNGQISIGLLYVPKRTFGRRPLVFRVNAKSYKDGSKAFSADQTYLRWNDECIPASRSDHYMFLVGERYLDSAQCSLEPRKIIKANLPARDPELVEYVSRPQLLTVLWSWFSDQRDPIRVFVGPGGLGKTTVAYGFAEEIVNNAPQEVERVVWLTAKKKSYSVFMDKLVNVVRTDFHDTRSFVLKLMEQLGADLSEFDEDVPTPTLLPMTVEILRDNPSLVVLDDIDSLEEDEQIALFSECQEIFNQTVGFDRPSKLLVTSRYKLPAGPRRLIPMPGFTWDEYREFVDRQCDFYSIDFDLIGPQGLLELFDESGASPIFVGSILKLVAEKIPLKAALSEWRGAEGEAVRRFVFERELSRLEPFHARVLYAVCLMGDASRRELEEITSRSQATLKDDILRLQAFYLVSRKTGKEEADPRFTVSSHIRSLVELVAARLTEAEVNEIKKNCARVVGRAAQMHIHVGRHVRSVIASRNANAIPEAIAQAQLASKEYPDNGDLKCLLGATLMLASPPRYKEADEAFRLAAKLGSERPELIDNWILAKKALSDWLGIKTLSDTIEATKIRLPIAANACAEAYINLLAQANERGDTAQLLSLALAGGSFVSELARTRKSPEAKAELVGARAKIFASYFESTCEYYPAAIDGNRIFDAMMACLDRDYCTSDILSRGLNGLMRWWEFAETGKARNTFRQNALQRNIARFDFLERKYAHVHPDDLESIEIIQKFRRQLSTALVAYSGRRVDEHSRVSPEAKA